MIRTKYTYEYVHSLVKQGIFKDINKELHSVQKLPLLHIAVLNRDERLVDYLLSEGANPNLHFFGPGTPLHLAVIVKNLEIIKRLINFGANVNTPLRFDPWFIPLHTAILENYLEIAEFLIKNGADVNFELAKDNPRFPGKTILNMAILRGHKEIVELLLKNNAIPNILIRNYGSPLTVAARVKNVAIMKILLSYGADINYAPEGKQSYLTPLNLAITRQDLEAVDLLLNNNEIKINPVTKEAVPVLHVAVIFVTNCCVIQRLLDAGVDVNPEVIGLWTVLDPVTVYRPSVVCRHIQFTIKKHIVKLRAAKLYLSKKLLVAVDSKEFNDLHNQCIVEIDKMKRTNIGVSYLTFYDVLHKSRHQLALGLQCVSVENVSDFDTKSIFPQYAGMINYRLNRALERKKMLCKVTDLIDDLFSEINLPWTFSRKLFEYLSYQDLRKLIPN